jgi:hypothetical protein
MVAATLGRVESAKLILVQRRTPMPNFQYTNVPYPSPLRKGRYKTRSIIKVIGPSIAYVPLTKGLFSVIDKEDADYLGQWNWCAFVGKHTIYAGRNWRCEDVVKPLSLHRTILPLAKSPVLDHKNGWGLDNRKANLRPATHQQNNYNTKMFSTNTTGFKGVTKSGKNHWRSVIYLNNTRKHLGQFHSPEEAHAAYVVALNEQAGEFAGETGERKYGSEVLVAVRAPQQLGIFESEAS